ncbi:hypothetical protein D3C84_766200 [compost metagenome]
MAFAAPSMLAVMVVLALRKRKLSTARLTGEDGEPPMNVKRFRPSGLSKRPAAPPLAVSFPSGLAIGVQKLRASSLKKPVEVLIAAAPSTSRMMLPVLLFRA